MEYKDVPKDLEKNLEFRIDLRRMAMRDAGVRRALETVCKHDILFWLSAFCWLYEPRPKIINGIRQPMEFPFIPWEHQEVAIREIKEHLGYKDIGVEKSRGEGMSWMGILLALHDWLFEPNSKIGLVSRTEEEADDPDDSDSLFWKIDWELTKLPKWMAGVRGKDYKRIIDRHNLINFRNGSRISADAATGDVFRGGRLSWAMMDEFAFFRSGEDANALNASHGATNSRLFVSTVNGQNNEFYRVMHEPSSMVKVVIDWHQNVSRNRGLYTMEKGIPVAVDPVDNPLPPDYDPPSQDILDMFSRLRHRGFTLEDKERSPWYDRECDRPGMTPQRVAQELDRDYSGSDFLVFDDRFRRKTEATIQEPVKTGYFDVRLEKETGEIEIDVDFQEVHDGPAKLWVPLDHRGRPPRGNYVFGADVSTGLGGSYTSNSTLIGIDLRTQEQVFEFASNTMEPSEFAELCVGVTRWFHEGYLGWEHNGPGSAMTKRVIELRYANIYRRKSQSKQSGRTTREIGWWTDEKTKRAMFSEILRTVRSNEMVIRSADLRNECSQYVYVNGKIEHAASLMTDDSSAKGTAHGDRVIAYGVALQCALDRPNQMGATVMHEDKKVEFGPNGEPPVGTLAARVQQWEDEKTKHDPDDWYEPIALNGFDPRW